MKRMIYALAMIVCLSACSKDDGGDGPNRDNSTQGSGQSQGTLKVSPENIQISSGEGKAYFYIESNTEWNIYANNSGSGIDGLSVSPRKGNGGGTIEVSYDAVTSTYYQQSASITIYYMSYGTRQSKTVSLYRKKLHY